MADPTPPVPQKLVFDTGILLVEQSFSSKNGLLHMTPEHGFFFGPGKPLTTDEIPDNLPEPYHTWAHEFVAAQVPPDPPVADAESSTADSESGSSYQAARRRR